MPPSSSGLIHEPTAFSPFSFGPASCVGKNLALIELRAVTCALVQRFEFEFENAGKEGFRPTEWEEAIEDYLVASRPPLMAKVEARKQ